MYLNQKMYKLFYFLLLFSSCIPTSEKENFTYEDNNRAPSSIDGAIASTAKPRTGDRFYVANVFKRVFGPTYNNGNYVKDNIIRNQGFFGGGCDLYEAASVGLDTSVVENEWNVCFGSDKNTDQILESSTLKEGWLIRACELVVSRNSSAVAYAFNQAEVGDGSEVNYNSLNRLYKLFYINDDLPRSAYDSLSKYSDSFNNNEFYKYSLLSFCISSKWIVL